jgi:hypothetical protein
MIFKHHLAASACALCLGALPAHAALTVLYSTDFNTPTHSDAALIGQDTWARTGTITLNPITVSNTATNGLVSLATTGEDANRVFPGAVTSGSVFLSATINVISAQATGDYFLHLGDGGTSNFFGRLYAKSSSTGYVLALATSSGTPTYGSTVLTLNSPQQILIRYDFVPGLINDTGALFLNPVSEDGSLDTPYVAATTVGTDATSISSVNLRQGNAANAATVTVDNLSVAASVPEPTSALLGLLAGSTLLRRRRA